MGQIFISGDAQPSDVAAPKKFSAGTNYQAAGTLPDRRGYPAVGQYVSAVSAMSDSGGNIVMEPPLGIYGPGKNAGNFGTLIANDPNFVPANWPSNKTMFGTPGTMPSYPLGTNITNVWADGLGNISFGFPVGAYLQGGGFGNPGTTEVHNFDPNHKASNILSGVTILGVNGTAIAGRPWASGTSTSLSSQWQAYYPDNSSYYMGYRVQGSSFSFNPSVVVISGDNDYCVFFTGGFKIGQSTSMVVHGYHFGQSWLAQVDHVFVAVRPGFFGLPVKYPSTTYNWFAVA
ncbi:hypothetical protein [Cohnella rhizosphaerae]|uniref:Uncharacterized protein n=1 Tax=Cohnella rhizosphaerae TaxID=1457232 RepID=A0A9X4QS53_9BACL|nr:hypothetical protein [Cohnella rhizosphaerae]MDG0809741.1 hypothetical protein [Cohnella rhizosphaerae]